jgi:hypothetical protein
MNLEPFILGGSFRKTPIPDFVLKKLVVMYEESNKQKVLERMLMQMDLAEFPKKEELIVVCEVNCLIGGLLYLMSLTQQHDDSNECMKILNTLLGLVRESKNTERGRDDVLMVQQTDSDTKFEIEKSRAYLGYKMIWIIKMFIDGKSFPQGTLSPDKHRRHIYDIVNFFMIEHYLIEILDFDAEQFYRVIARIF